MIERITPRIKSIVASQEARTLGVLILTNLILALIGFFTRLKIANLLGTTEFGSLAFGIALAGYTTAFVRYGTDKTLVRDIIHDGAQKGEIIAGTFVTQVLFLIVSLIGYGVFLNIMSGTGQSLIWVIIGYSLLGVDAKGAFDGTRNTLRHTLFYVAQRSVFLAGIWIIILAIPTHLTVQTVGLVTAISASLFIALQYSWLLKRYPFAQTLGSALLYTRGLLSRNLHVFVAALAGMAFSGFNQVILRSSCGASDLGVYAAAWQFFWVADMLMAQIARVGAPKMAHLTTPQSGKNDRIRGITGYLAIMTACIIPVAFPMIVYPELVISTFLKPEFAHAVTPLRLIGIYTIVLAIGRVFSQYLVSSHLDRDYSRIVMATGAISMVFSLLVIPRFGPTGAAVSLLLTHGLAIVSYVIFAGRDILARR